MCNRYQQILSRAYSLLWKRYLKEMCVLHPRPCNPPKPPQAERTRGASASSHASCRTPSYPLHAETTALHSHGRGVNLSKTSSVHTHTHTLHKNWGRGGGEERWEDVKGGEGLRKRRRENDRWRNMFKASLRAKENPIFKPTFGLKWMFGRQRHNSA